MFRRIPKPAPTFKTSSARSTATALRKRVLGALALATFACLAARPLGAADAGVPLATIFAAYERATHASDVATLETAGTIAGEGLDGEFHSWRSGENERDDERLGPRTETTLRRGARIWVSNANGNVRELHGVLLRRALTAQFVDSGAFLRAPERARFVGYGSIGAERVWRVEVNADGGEPETLWIGVNDGLPLRTEYIDGDGPTFVDLSDWRDVDGQRMPFRSVTTDGDHAYDVIEQTTFVRTGQPIDDAHFAPLPSRTIDAEGVQTVPLVQIGPHIGCTVTIEGRAYAFLIDSGAQNVLVDAAVAHRLHLDEVGSLEVRGAVRTGGLHVAHLAHLGIGSASLDDLLVSTIDLQPGLGGAEIDGILGYPFFAASVVQLDFAQGVMRFGPPGSFAPPGERIALDVDREIPEATVRLNDALNAPFIVDTGNSGEMLLYEPFVGAHPGVVPATGSRSTNYGVGGSDVTYRTHLDAVRIGDLPVARPTVDVVEASTGAFADRTDAGNLGLGVLRNFVVTFDLGNGAMYLLPNGGFAQAQKKSATNS
jgi:hypothetical protein